MFTCRFPAVALATLLALPAAAGNNGGLAPTGLPVARGAGAAAINCAGNLNLRRAQARIYRVDLAEAERGVVFAWAPGNVKFRCLTDRHGRVVRVLKKSGGRPLWLTAP